MDESQRIEEAERIVTQVQRRLPPDLRTLAHGLPVVMHAWPSAEIVGEEFPPDILGLFVGAPQGWAGEGSTLAAPHILLFVESIWDFSAGDLNLFRQEVKLTYLHELGHFLGWDEEEVAARGLD